MAWKEIATGGMMTEDGKIDGMRVEIIIITRGKMIGVLGGESGTEIEIITTIRAGRGKGETEIGMSLLRVKEVRGGDLITNPKKPTE